MVSAIFKIIFASVAILHFAGVTAATNEVLKAYQNCPEGQFFEIETQSYRKCDTFCKNGTGTASCQRQCAVYFLKIEDDRKDRANEEKFSKFQDEIKELKESISTQQPSVQPVNVFLVIAITVATVVVILIIGIVARWLIQRYKPQCCHWHTVPKHDPENGEYRGPNQSSGTENRIFNSQPQNDSRQEEINEHRQPDVRIEIGTTTGASAPASS